MRHLPYEIDESTNRFCFYENFWKRRGLELLLKHGSPQGKSLLDYGSGRGECLDLATRAGFKVEGTDIDPECIRLSSKYGLVHPLSSDPVKQFGAKSFDVITCLHVLEHVE